MWTARKIADVHKQGLRQPEKEQHLGELNVDLKVLEGLLVAMLADEKQEKSND